MGWLYCENSRSDLIKSRTKGESSPDGSKEWRCLAHSARGNVLWTVWEIADISSNVSRRFIGCDLLARSGGTWGYKDMSEEMHPYYYSCPLSYLDMVPVACEAWRDGVRKYHEKRSRKFAVGEVVKLVAGCSPPEVTVTSVKPLRGSFGGINYKVSPRHIA